MTILSVMYQVGLNCVRAGKFTYFESAFEKRHRAAVEREISKDPNQIIMNGISTERFNRIY